MNTGMIKTLGKFLSMALLCCQSMYSQEVLVEAESFDNPGGWLVDSQFKQQMGSPYLSTIY